VCRKGDGEDIVSRKYVVVVRFSARAIATPALAPHA
jgi:hypothetical protein